MTQEKCKIEYKSDDILGWKLKMTGDCSSELAEIEQLPEKRGQYLKRRIDYSSDSSSTKSS